MSIEEAARGLYVLSLISVIVFGIFMTLRYRPASHASLSQILGSSQGTYISSAVILSLLSGGLFYGLTEWFIPYHSLPEWSLYLTIAVLILIILLAWLPTDGNTNSLSHKIHFTIGGTLGACFTALVIVTIYYSNELNVLTYWISVASVIFCTMCYFLYFFIKDTRRWFLTLELVAVGSMLFALLLLAY